MMTPQQIQVAFSNAFKRNVTKAELTYWGTKQDTELRDKLAASTKPTT